MKPTDDEALYGLLGMRPPPGPCPDAGLLVGWAEGRLDAERRAPLEAHLALCDDCRADALLLRHESAASLAAPRQAARTRSWPLRLLGRPLVMAALLLAALGVTLWATDMLPGGARSAASVPERLLAAAEDLARLRGGILGRFTPLSAAELANGHATALRGGIALVRLPAVSTSDRPAIAWQPVDGVERYAVTLLGPDGADLWTRSTNLPLLTYPTDVPALPRGGSYVVQVSAEAPLGHVEVRRGFQVASEADVRRFEDGVQLLRAEAPADIADLLVAHLALRHGFTLEAESAAAAQANAHPLDETSRATLAHARRVLGLP